MDPRANAVARKHTLVLTLRVGTQPPPLRGAYQRMRLNPRIRISCALYAVVVICFAQSLVAQPATFYVNYENVYVNSGTGCGFYTHGWVQQCTTETMPIGVYLTNGSLINHNDNPHGNSFIPLVVGGADPVFGQILISNSGVDEEGSFPLQRCCMFVVGGGLRSLESINSIYLGFGNVDKPAIIYAGLPTSFGGYVAHLNDTIGVDPDAPAVTSYQGFGLPTGQVSWEEVGIFAPDFTGPLSDVPGLIAQRLPGKVTNQSGISATDTPANNIAGTFTILNGFTSGGPTFFTEEPDDNYVVAISYLGHSGTSPAAGSTTPGP